MRFFGREDEIKELQEIRKTSLQAARFTIVTGRRRSGKTCLLLKAYENVDDLLYFFVGQKYFRAKMAESEAYTHIASWWDRKGENEIDIIASDELEHTVTFYEVKRQAKDVNLGILKDKAEHFFQATGKFRKFSIEYKGLCMENM